MVDRRRTPDETVPAPEPLGLDPQLRTALRSLSPVDREALLLIAWEDLTPTRAARALRINPTAFRVRLLRARLQLREILTRSLGDPTRRVPRADHAH